MSELAEWSVADPGPGARLAGESRAELAAAVRGWNRSGAGAVLLEVGGAAWAAVPDDRAGLDERRAVVAAQDLVAALFGLARPLVVSVDGPVCGYGLAVLLCADVRVGGPHTTVAVGDRPRAALIGAGRWLAGHHGATAAWDRMAATGATLDRDAAVDTGILTAAGDRASARSVAERLAGDPGWASVKRAARARVRSELAGVLRYEGWLATPATG